MPRVLPQAAASGKDVKIAGGAEIVRRIVDANALD